MGLLSWQWFSATVTGCSTALGAEARLVRSTQLPREIWVLKVVGSKGAEFIFSLPIVALFMVLYHRAPSWQIVLVPVAIVLQAILLTGIGLALAPATVLIRDLAAGGADRAAGAVLPLAGHLLGAPARDRAAAAGCSSSTR